MKATYLVTGGAGFIGSNFVKYLTRRYPDEHIVALDALTYAGNVANIKDEIDAGHVTFIHGDINDSAVVNSILAEYDPQFIVNFAAESHVDRSIENPRLFLETNILGTQTLLDAARRAWATGDGTYRPGHRFLQISTDEVYGSLSKDYDVPRPIDIDNLPAEFVATREDTPAVAYGERMFDETTPLAPRSPYSAAKASADMLVLAYHDTYGLPVCITRCSNNYGPYHFPEKLIPLIINNILNLRKLPVYGRGENVRDWLYVEDHASAIDAVLKRGRDGEVYNVGGFNEQQNIDIVKTVIALMHDILAAEPGYRRLLKDGDPEAINDSLITYVTDRPGHDMRYAINPAKIAAELGWYPMTPFREGIEKTVRWYLDNPEWVAAVTSGAYREYYDKMYGNR
ncbi:MAG: dTDP-glucose 4,6-dehydratase [Muribaculaceae bacterium]|nr:dTDP-glucose 4,6-dehydratase [Muribaculaceae bacterium]